MKHPVNIVCVKTGTKYSSKNVERLYKMVKRNCTLPFIFYCLTDNTNDLPKDVVGIKLDESLYLDSYWWKMCLFNLGWNEPILYFDLDIIIQKDIKSLFYKIKRDKLLVIDNEYVNLQLDYWPKYPPYINSSVIGMWPKDHNDIFNFFIKNTDLNILKYYGLDRFLSNFFLKKCDYLNFDTDYYHRYKFDETPRELHEKRIIQNETYFLAKDPSKILCIFSQAEQEMYEGMEEYLL